MNGFGQLCTQELEGELIKTEKHTKISGIERMSKWNEFESLWLWLVVHDQLVSPVDIDPS